MQNKTKKNILIITGLSLLLTGTASASTPAKPGPYVGVYDVTENSARISYLDNASNEDGFKVYIYNNTNGVLDSTISPNPIIVPKNDGGSLYQYTNLTGLTPHTFYEVRVSSFNSDGESTPTDPSSENGGRFNTVHTCNPEMPGEYVGVWNITTSGARISFKDNSDNEDGFKAYVYNYNTNALVDTILMSALAGKGGNQYTNITGLTPNTLYKVRVSAYNGCGESKKTTPSSATNGRFRTNPTICPVMPGKYVGVYNVTSNSARISFLDNSDNESGFKAYVYEYDTNLLVDTIIIPSASGVGKYRYSNITGLKPNTKYYVRVSAFNSNCESPKTNPSSEQNGRFKTNP
ncbi:MAG: fibronectin type III domain-containing protein [Sulfurovaceae bacterium]|nr:fibronectin type III domain-containing protein [Sulfurovaceae bacterium]